MVYPAGRFPLAHRPNPRSTAVSHGHGAVGGPTVEVDGMKICFYSGVHRPEDLDMYSGHRTDVEILTELGFSVHASTRPRDLSFTSDAYFTWWAASGFLPMLLAKARRKPFHLVAGGDDVVTEYPNFGFWKRRPATRR